MREGHRQHLRFYIVDVFTHEPLTGNPLAIVADAQGLDEALMRRIAREFNQTEMTVTEYGYKSDRIVDISRVGLEQCLDKMAATFAG